MTKTKAKAETIYLELREHIRGLEEGVRLSSVLELRQKFQTSQHSVDKALDRLEREKLIIKKPRLGIRVAPRPEKEVASKRIAFAAWTSGHSKELSGGSHPYYGPIIQTIAEQAALLGYEESVYLFRSHGILDSGTTLERDISKGLISGLIISSWDLTKKDLPFLEAHGVHTVLIGTDHLQCGYPCVTVNNVKLGLLTSQATMSSGRSPVAVISAEDPRIDVETFLMTQESEGNPVQPGYHIHYPPLKGGDQEAIKRGREAAEKLLALYPKPKVVWITDDIVGIGAIQALHHAGVHIPHDMAVIVSTTTTSMFTHPVVRVAFDPAAQGKMAVSQVDALIKGQVLEKQIDYLDPVLLDLENLSQARD